MTHLAHQVLEDGRVLIKFGDGAFRRISADEAKRFAWALLADLDPDGIRPTRTEYKKAAPRRQTEALHSLARGNLTAPAVGADIGVRPQDASKLLNSLVRRGLVFKMAVSKRRDVPLTWGLTPAGAREVGHAASDRTAPERLAAVMRAIAAGATTRNRVAAALGIDPNCAHMRLRRLHQRGFAREVVKGRPHAPGVWELTDAGYAEIGEAPPLERAA